jgi:phosphatidylglycerol:prolipoprotein diacylglycerol transferase
MRKRFLYFFGLVILAVLIYCLRQVFSGILILPQVFNLGPLGIHYYGLIMALAVACGFYLAIKRAKAYGINPKTAEDLLFWLIIGGFIGARLYHVLSSAPYYYSHPLDMIKVWNGGLSIYGALIGGLVSLLICKKSYNLQLTTYNLLDWLTPSLIVGQIIGRFGNLFNYEAFGYPTNLPWKMFVPLGFRPQGFEQFAYFHPFFLYELSGNLIILFLLLKVIKPKVPGNLFFSYVLLYNLLRFALEFLRIDSTFINGFRLNAAVSLALVVLGITALIFTSKHAETA